MKSIYTTFIAVLLLSACNSGSKDPQELLAGRTKTVLRSFSDTTALDTFRIVLTGEKPKDMELVFTIVPKDGKQIYTKTLKATALLDNYKETVDLDKKKQQIKFMEQELDLFFDEENFIEPAVTESEEADENMPDKKFFEELKVSSLNGFQYRLGKESKVYIAWSDQEKKVKVYYQCCQK
ncbi:hypothetical protein ACSBL2_10320 [Pedobacter sp. AW31-3R]|uniref:hypothetical protein n=1 Tax=Pedobacter sp. AW31-3R TaxID=3445781 RepID=UPI003F9F894E